MNPEIDPTKPTQRKRGGSAGRRKLTEQARAERLAYAAEVFKTGFDPATGKTLSVPKANAKVKARFGETLNCQNMIALRNDAVAAGRGRAGQ